jgi:hypothetical protein
MLLLKGREVKKKRGVVDLAIAYNYPRMSGLVGERG